MKNDPAIPDSSEFLVGIVVQNDLLCARLEL